MRLATYLGTSRHGIYYFRWPIPIGLHPHQKRSDVKLSLGTRSPSAAQYLSRLLAIAGQSLMMAASVRSMRYDEIRAHVRDHFGGLLRQFREKVAEGGQIADAALEGVKAAQGLYETGLDYWAELSHQNGKTGLLSDFCARHGVNATELTATDRQRVLEELYKGDKAFLKSAIDHNASFDRIDLEDQLVHTTVSTDAGENVVIGYRDVVARYFEELRRSGALAAKTECEKRDALNLLGLITGDKSPALMTKADAQKVKAVLLRLPKNRNKNPLTRGLALDEMLALDGVEIIAARTANVYISSMQTFFKWLVDNGYASENVFIGMRVKVSKKAKNSDRIAFNDDQLRTLYLQLTENPVGLVNKEEHKWGPLISMFTGMRLNEVAQLEVDDVKCIDGIWCIDVTEDGGDNKRLKNVASHRRVPVHERLIGCGLLNFVKEQRATASTRLFPKLSYSAQNGYGRNIGRWFNERLLPALEMKREGLVFHSLRHTMVTKLNHSDVAETQVRAIVGHAQSGMTFANYFKAGFLPTQLHAAICKFDF